MNIRELILRGVVRSPDAAVPVRIVPGPDLPDLHEGGLAVLLPTYVSRCDLAEHRRFLTHLIERLAEVHAAHPELPINLWLGMQWASGEEGESMHRLWELCDAAAGVPWLGAVGLSLPGPGKLRTTNAALRLTRRLSPAGWLWVDDDVFLEPQCLSQLVSRFLARGARGAVGAAKVAQAKEYRASRLMLKLGRLTTPHRSYPHACCMVVAGDVVAGGVPEWLGTDDGFVLFELLDHSRADPWAELEIVPTARCRYFQGARTGDTLRRLHRAMYSHVLHVASNPWPVGRAYLSESLLYGLWPLAPWDRRSGIARWSVKAIQFGWFCAVAGSLAARGIVKRPRRPPTINTYAEHWSALRSAHARPGRAKPARDRPA